jgi:hypothetical protein
MSEKAEVRPGDDDGLAPDEAYCTSCGEAIKAEAEMCPHCGVRQKEETPTPPAGDSSLPEARKYELQKVARKDQATTAMVSFLIPFVGYLMVGKTTLAIINILTLNYLLTGFVVVPIHTYKIIGNAQDELARHGENW